LSEANQARAQIVARKAISAGAAFRRAALAAGAVLCLASSHGLAQREAASKPFEGMAGTWSGTGTVTLGSGDKERIRCRVIYTVANSGERVEQDLRCASDSYKFELTTDITHAKGYVTGRWNEKTRRTSGPISGTASPGQIDALAETSGFAAFITMTTRGDRQAVKIESKSPDISEVSITLRRMGSEAAGGPQR
jgi:hypothetical protein